MGYIRVRVDGTIPFMRVLPYKLTCDHKGGSPKRSVLYKQLICRVGE